MRERVGLYLSWMILFVGVAMTAHAQQQVAAGITHAEMRAFVYSALAIAGLAVVGGVAGVLAWILARDRDLQRENMSRLEHALSEIGAGLHDAIRALDAHNSSPYAHGPASEHNHGPMNDTSDRIEGKLDRLIEDCLRHRCGLAPRNPKDSPHPRREGDSGADYTALRGKP